MAGITSIIGGKFQGNAFISCIRKQSDLSEHHQQGEMVDSKFLTGKAHKVMTELQKWFSSND